MPLCLLAFYLMMLTDGPHYVPMTMSCFLLGSVCAVLSLRYAGTNSLTLGQTA